MSAAVRGLTAACVAYFLVILDAGILNVALPSIADGLHSSVAAGQWTITTYTLTLAALLLPSGALVDRWGVRRMLVGGTALFTLASAWCAVADSVGALVSARALQGVGAAALLPATLAAVPILYEQGPLRERASVTWVATGALAMALAPFAGGALIQFWNWRAAFGVNVPIGILTCLVGARSLPTQTLRPREISWTGQVLVAALLASGTGAIALAEHPQRWPFIVVCGVVVVSIAGFVGHELRARTRVVPAGFLADSARRTAVVSAALMGFSFYTALLFLSLWFQQRLGLDPLAAGTALLPITVSSIVGPLYAYRRLAQRWGAARVLAGGFATVLLGALALLPALSWQHSYLATVASMLLIGGASTVCFSALTSMLMQATEPAVAGLASALQNTTRQAAAAVAVATVATASAGRGHPLLVVLILTVAALSAVLLAGRHVFRPSSVRNLPAGDTPRRNARSLAG